jgi:putative ABC transport system permease protein
MIGVGLRMLFGDPVKLAGMVVGMALATLLVIQQGALFLGLMSRSQNGIADVPAADVWVMHPATAQYNLAKPFPDNERRRIAALGGVSWVAPLIRASVILTAADGSGRAATLIGLDEATLAGAPERTYAGDLASLGQPDAVAIDRVGFTKLWPGEPVRPGKVFRIGGRRAVVVAITEPSAAFAAEAILHVPASRVRAYAPEATAGAAFLLVGVDPDVAPAAVARAIEQATGLAARTSADFSRRTVDYYIANTGIAASFFTTIALGLFVAACVVGLTFSLFVLENLPIYAVLKTLGLSQARVAMLVLSQVGVAGAMGFAFGAALSIAFFDAVTGPTSALRGFHVPLWILGAAALAMLGVTTLATAANLGRVLRAEPAAVLRGQL